MADRPCTAETRRHRQRRPARILVVDDERSMRELLSIVLKREGHDVLVAENGAAAVELLKRRAVRPPRSPTSGCRR